VEVHRLKEYQITVTKNKIAHTKKGATFYAGHVLDVLLRKWFLVGASLCEPTHQGNIKISFALAIV
jgi:hypothetical protein